MVGYGPEDTHFVIELTYNYGIKSYEKGNDFIGITIKSKEALERAKQQNWPVLPGNVLEAPGGYKFFILDEPQPVDKGNTLNYISLHSITMVNLDPVQKVTLASSNLVNSLKYWNEILGLKIFEKTEKSILLGFDENQAKLELQDIGEHIIHDSNYLSKL